MNNSRRRKIYCAECGAVFAPWEEMYSWSWGRHSGYVCCDCFDELFNELSRFEKAELIGSEIVTADFNPLMPS